MRRRVFNIGVALSLVLWLATTVLWLRARFAQDVIAATDSAGRLIRVHIKENGVVIASIAPWPRHEPLSWRWAATGKAGYGMPVIFDGKTMRSRSVFPGVNYDTGTGTVSDPALPNVATTPVRGSFVVIVWAWPLAITLALAGPLLAIAGRRWAIRRQRRAKGLCLSCGYDLRASPDRCPECGHIGARRTAA
jgi:hypothetical protein